MTWAVAGGVLLLWCDPGCVRVCTCHSQLTQMVQVAWRVSPRLALGLLMRYNNDTVRPTACCTCVVVQLPVLRG